MISVDPGTKVSAAARWADGELQSVWWAPIPIDSGNLVIEVPVLRPYGKADPQDILDLMRVVEKWAGQAGRIVEIKPETWKGQTPKPIHHRRILEALTPVEREVFAMACGHTVEDIRAYVRRACETLARLGVVARYSRKSHNLFDAVGIGLWYLGRTSRAGVKL